MAIKQPDSGPFSYLDYFGNSQVILVPIHENRIGEEGYEQMLLEARLFADTYDKMLVGVLEAYCTYSDHPILGNIPVVPTGQAGSGTVPRPLTVYDSREEGWRAVAQGLAEVLEPYRLFFQQGIRGSVYFDKEQNAWCFDKGRKDGVSIWHREVSLAMENGPLSIGIQQVFPDYTVLKGTAGFNTGSDKVFQATIRSEPRWEINLLIQDHASNSNLVEALRNDSALQQHGIHFTNEIPWLDYVLHLTQTHMYLTQAFENPEDEVEEFYLNPYRPLTKPIALSSGRAVIQEFLKQVANWVFLRRLEAPYGEAINEAGLQVSVFHSQGKDWERLDPEGEWVSVPLWAKQFKGGVSYENTIRIQLMNRSERSLYISAFLLASYFGSGTGLTEEGQFELKPGEQILLFQRGEGSIPVELSGRTIIYNVPYETLEVKFLASNQPFSTNGYWMKAFPGPPGSGFREEEGYFMEKAMDLGEIKPLEGVFIAPLLRIRLDNPVYNRPNAARLEELLQRPDAENFIRALHYVSIDLAPSYLLKNGMELQEMESPGSKMSQSSVTRYLYTPNGLTILEFQLQQLQSELQLRGKAEKPILVALGDSWFNQAEPIDIAEELKKDYLVVKAPLRDWGQLEEAMQLLEKTIAGAPSITLLLSPMGELLLDKPGRFIKSEAPDNTEDIRNILDKSFFEALDEVRVPWESGFSRLSGLSSNLQVVIHGYDYYPADKYSLRFGEFSFEWRNNVIAFMVDVLNARLLAAIKKMGATNIHYLDLRRTLEPQEWNAAVIPDQAGFRKLAGQVSLFIGEGYSFGEEPYLGTEYFLWQIAVIEGTEDAYRQLIEAYPEGAHRAWAEERLRKLEVDSYPQAQSQSQSFEPEAVQQQEPDALQSLRRRANQLISSNQLADVFQLLDRELRRDAEPRERLAIYRKELTQLERQRRRYKRPSKQLDRDMASLADAVGELVEGLGKKDLLSAASITGSFSIGTKVKFRNNQDKGVITEVLENDMVEVALDDSELTIPVFIDDLIRAGADRESKVQGAPKTDTFTDPRDGRIYRTVELNGQVWLAENLNFDVLEECWFYADDPKNGEKYGRLYTWAAAKKACPPGWRLPSDEEWSRLRISFGGEKEAYLALIEGGKTGFNVVLGGYRDPEESYNEIDVFAGYWSETDGGNQNAWNYDFNSFDRNLTRYFGLKSFAYSCRCVQDIPISKNRNEPSGAANQKER